MHSGQRWGEIPSSAPGEKVIWIFNCPNCHHKWIPSSSRLPQKDAEEIIFRESPEIGKWALRHIPKDILATKKMTVLDIGCWDGSLLNSLPCGWNLYGVEPNVKAADEAMRKGITVYRNFIHGVPLESGFFDIVFMLNILEHLSYPLDTIKQVSRCLKTDGILIVVTGNSDSFAAKIYKGGWYYFSYNEHISFFSPDSIATAFEASGLSLSAIKKVYHHSAKYSLTAKKVIMHLLRLYDERNSRLFRPDNKSDRFRLLSSRIIHTKDHLWAVARKRGID